MVRHTFKKLQRLLRNFKNVSDHFGTLCIKGLTISYKKRAFLIEFINLTSGKFAICIYVMPELSKILRKKINFHAKFSIYYLMMTIWM